MKTTVIFRATFEQPLGALNRGGYTMKAPVEVELYQAKASEWRARRPGTRYDFEHITPQSQLKTMMNQIAGVFFKKQLTEWEAFDSATRPPTSLLADEWHCDKEGKVYLTEAYRERKKAKAARPANVTPTSGELL